MTMRLKFQPLGSIAPSDSFTGREWEALARSLGELEADSFSNAKFAHSPYGADAPRDLRIAAVQRALLGAADYIDEIIRDKLTRAGFRPFEFVITATPRIGREDVMMMATKFNENDWLWPDLTWDVNLILFGEKSEARNAIDRATKGDVVPT